MASNTKTRLHHRYGICLNDSCSKCKSKEVQQLSAHKQLVCAECGKPLRECPPPRSWWDKHGKMVIGGGVAAAVIAGGLLFGLSGDGDKTESTPNAPQPQAVETRVDEDSLRLAKQQEEEARKQAEQQRAEQQRRDSLLQDSIRRANESQKPKVVSNVSTVQNGHGTLNLPYGKYVGDIRNGKPDGAGVLTYTRAQKVVSTKDIVAQPGERIEGVFENGKATFVTLYKKNGNSVKVKR